MIIEREGDIQRMNSEIHKSKCETCGRLVRSFDMVHLSQHKKTTLLCSKCYNEFVAKYMELDFQHVDFDPITMGDIDGVPHTFEFRTHMFGANVSIEAFEIKDSQISGYEFAVAGDAEGDMLLLFGKLFDKMRSELGRRHIEKAEYTRYQITDDDTVRAQIAEEDGEDGQLPCLVIDGKELSWSEFGRMLMTYNGFNMKLEIFDRFEDMG